MAAPRHVYQIFIRATPEQVWEAIIDPAFTRRYFHGTAFESTSPPGASRTARAAGRRRAVDGVIEELDPPNRLVMTWHMLYDAGDGRGAAEPGRVDPRRPAATASPGCDACTATWRSARGRGPTSASGGRGSSTR